MTDATNNAAAQPKPELTKDEKIAKIKEQIARLEQRLDDVVNDRAPQPKAKKEVYTPAVGDVVLATVGRNSKTTQARVEQGVVKAVKLGADLGEGKKSPTQVRVEFGEGFDAQIVTLYPAQLQKVEQEEASPEEDGFQDDGRAIGELPQG